MEQHTSSQIVKLPISDNQHVSKNDLLFVVDPRPYRFALDSAKTKLNLTEVESETFDETINSAAAQLAERRVEPANSKQYFDRVVTTLRTDDFVTDNDVLEARNKLKAAEATAVSVSLGLVMRKMCCGCWEVNQRGRAAQEEIDDAQLNSDYAPWGCGDRAAGSDPRAWVHRFDANVANSRAST